MEKKSGVTGAIIVAAGKGSRMGLGYNKVLAPLCGKPVIEWTIRSFVSSELIDKLVLVINPEDENRMKEICRLYKKYIDFSVVYGGKERQDSVYSGLKHLGDNTDLVLIHDGARPFINKELISKSIRNALKYGAACAGMPVKETIKIVDEDRSVLTTPERKTLWAAQTPQAFKMDIILKSYQEAYAKGLKGTDDAGLAEAAGYKVKMFEGSYQNIKLTSPEELLLAEQILLKDNPPHLS